MSPKIRTQLSVMMFLEFFVWGVWFVTMGTYLVDIGFTGVDIAAAYSTTNWGAFLAPFFIGMIADRFFSAQKVLGVLHLPRRRTAYWASTIQQPGPFFWALLAYALLYMPTLALVNAISFHQMKDPGTNSRGVRVLGTIGWIVAGILVGKILKPWNARIEATDIPMQIGDGVSLVLGLYSFTLPVHAAQVRGQEGHRARRAGAGRPGSDEGPVLRDPGDLVAADLHPARLLLQLHESVPERDQGRGRSRVQHDLRPDVRDRVHAADAVLPAPAGHQEADDHRHAGLERALRACSPRAAPAGRQRRCTSGSSCTASATTSSSSAGRSTSIGRRPNSCRPAPRGSSPWRPTASAC